MRHLDRAVGDRVEVDAVADHPGLAHRGVQAFAGLFAAVLGDLRVVVVEEPVVVGVEVGQRGGGADPQVPQRPPLPGVEPASGDRRRRILRAHLLGAPHFVGALPALRLADRGDQRVGVVGGAGDPRGGGRHLQPEGVLVVVALQHRAEHLAAAAGEGGAAGPGQVVPDEHRRGVRARKCHQAGAEDRPGQLVLARMQPARLQHPGVVRQLQAVLEVVPAGGQTGGLPAEAWLSQRGHQLGRLLGRLNGLVVLDVGRQVAAADPDQNVRAAGAPAGGVVGQPPTQHERRPGPQGLQCRRDGVGFAEPGIDEDRAALMDVEKSGEHLLLVAHAGVEVGLNLRRGFPHQGGHQRREGVVGAHRALFGGIAAQQDRVGGHVSARQLARIEAWLPHLGKGMCRPANSHHPREKASVRA